MMVSMTDSPEDAGEPPAVDFTLERAHPHRRFHIDAGGDASGDPVAVEAGAIAAESDGYDGALATETQHDPFVGLTLAARRTERIRLGSAIAVAFARNPMTVAVTANDLATVSHGRFMLGLGSQVRPHIERRFSMTWSQPAKRMAEFVEAVRAIWHSWASGDRLNFRGEFYQHTLMTPFFDPGPNPNGTPPILIAGVGERMTEVAGRVADGFLSHSFTTKRYLEEVSIPALQRGRAAAGRDPHMLGIGVPAFVVIGETQAQQDAAALATKKQIAFYGSTPAYRGVLDLHGWAGLHERLHPASQRGEWDAMGAMIDDEVLAEFAVTGTPREVAAQLVERFGEIASRVSFNAPYPVEPGLWWELLAELDSIG